MKKALCMLLTLCLLCGLAVPALGEGHLEGKPWPNPEWPENLPDERPALEDDFYLYINYDLHKQFAMEMNTTKASTADVSEKEMQEDIWRMVEAGETTEAKALQILSSLSMDAERRNAEGLEPLLAYTRRVRETKSVEELTALCREEGFLFGLPFATYRLQQSEVNPERFAILLGLPFLVPLRELNDVNASNEEDLGLLTKRLIRMGWDEDAAEKMTERVLQFDAEMTGGDMLPEDFELMGQVRPLTAREIQALSTPLYLQLLSQGMIREGDEDQPLYEARNIPSFRYLGNIYKEENLDLFQAVICLGMYEFAISYLDQENYNEVYGDKYVIGKDMAYRYLTERAANLTEQAYTDAYIPQEQRETVKALTEDCKLYLANWMQSVDWISEESRENLVKKAREMHIVVVTPEERMDYEPLLKAISQEGITFLQAGVQLHMTILRAYIRLAGQAFYRGHRFLFGKSAIEANAVYEPNKNTFYILAGMLRPQYYDDSSRETLLASIGQTIAHEMSHGFEANGMMYDWEGNRNVPLTQEDLLKFQEKCMKLVENLNKIEMADGTYMDGQFKLLEESADLMGLRLLLDVAEETEGFDYDLFFRTLARRYFRSYPDKDYALLDYPLDMHPSNFVRINYTFSQFDEFYRTYPTVREGTGMYYPPEERESLW